MGLLAFAIAFFAHFYAHRLAAWALGVKVKLVFPGCCGPREPAASKPWKRMVMLASGPLASYLLAVLPLTFLAMGETDGPSLTIESVAPGLPAEQAGLKAGDEIFGIDGDRAMDFSQLRDAVALNQNPIRVDVHRPGEIVQVALTPVPGADGRPVVGIVPRKEIIRVGFIEAFIAAHQVPQKALETAMKPRLQTVGGPMLIFKTPSGQRSSDLIDPLAMALLIAVSMWSALLAAFHLVPLPGFDGLMFMLTLREAFGGKGPDEAWHARGRRWVLGLALLAAIGFSALVLKNDLRHLLRKL